MATTYASMLTGGTNGALASLLSGYMADGVTPVALTQRVSAGFMAPGQTAKQYVGKQALSATVATTITLETVTIGKTYYITDLFIATDVASSVAIIDTRVQAGGVDIFRAPIHNLLPASMTGIETEMFATSGQVVTILLPITPTGPNIYFNLYGFEQ